MSGNIDCNGSEKTEQNASDFLGKTFGCWKVLEETSRLGTRRAFVCECKCGRTSVVRDCNLKSGCSKQCKSCSSKEKALRNHNGIPKSANPYYEVWLRLRVSNELCKDWQNDFWSFVDFVSKLDHCKQENNLGRIDTRKQYEPGNVIWKSHVAIRRDKTGWKNATSRYKGVSWSTRAGKWCASINMERMRTLGFFESETEAAKRYDEAAKVYQDARLNFPIDDIHSASTD